MFCTCQETSWVYRSSPKWSTMCRLQGTLYPTDPSEPSTTLYMASVHCWSVVGLYSVSFGSFFRSTKPSAISMCGDITGCVIKQCNLLYPRHASRIFPVTILKGRSVFYTSERVFDNYQGTYFIQRELILPLILI